MQCLTRNEAIPYDAMKLGMSWDWQSFPEFMERMQNRVPKGINMISYVPLTPVYGLGNGLGGVQGEAAHRGGAG